MLLAHRARGLLVTLLACLCINNAAGCAPCARASRDALVRFEADHPGHTPGQLLERAIGEHRADVVLGILERDAAVVDLNAPLDPSRHDSTTPLMTALGACDAKIVSLVAGRPGFELAASLAPFARWRWGGTCPSEVAAAFLAIPGADPSAADGNGETLLHAAARSPAAIETLRVLLARPDIAADARDASGMSPLHVAAVAGNPAAVELLVARADVDVNNRNTLNRFTVLMNAVFAGHDAIVERLLARPDVDVNASSELGDSALGLAAEHGRTASALRLLGHPEIRVNAKDHLGRTPLTRAAFAGHAAVVAALLAHPAIAVNLVDRDRQTPLWWATAGKRAAVVRLLLADPRVDSSITSRPGRQTARDLAVELGLGDLVPELDRHAAAHPGTDQLASDDDYVERSYEHPPPTYVRPEPRRPH
jgi:ankyrin repeat protein